VTFSAVGGTGNIPARTAGSGTGRLGGGIGTLAGLRETGTCAGVTGRGTWAGVMGSGTCEGIMGTLTGMAGTCWMGVTGLGITGIMGAACGDGTT